MENKIKNILNKQKEYLNCKDMIFEKENDILSCIKSVGEEGIRLRQKKAALSLLDLKKKKENIKKELKELCKGLDIKSFNNKKLSSNIISECISYGIGNENLKILKDLFKNL